jgi:hypothetical protein
VTDDVPRLPRGRGLRLSRVQMVRIAGTLVLLAFLIVMQRPCADAVSKFVTGFGDQGSSAAQMPRPDNIDPGIDPGARPGSADGSGSATYEHLRPGMSEAELKAAIERARARAHGSAGQPAGGATQP